LSFPSQKPGTELGTFFSITVLSFCFWSCHIVHDFRWKSSTKY
jgi:hypothetical protein